MLGLRRAGGIDRAMFHSRFEVDLNELAGETICRFVDAGLLADDGASIRLTPRGRTLADTVVADFL